MNFKKAIISIFLIFAILSTTTVAFAAQQDWNGITFEVPESYSVGTPGSDKIGMMHGKEAVVLENFDQEKLDELNKEMKPTNETTYKIEDTEVTEYVYEREEGKLHFLKFNKDGKDYDLIYEDLKAAEEEEAPAEENATADNATENNTTDANATADNTTDANATENSTASEEEADSFNGADKESPAYIIISSIKAKK